MPANFPFLSKFQPTPPVAGERSPSARRQSRRPRAVSTHAPRCRGAKRRGRRIKPDVRVVSTHAPRCRGAKLWFLQGAERMTKVSTHAPRCRGAKLHTRSPTRAPTQFQPTPPVAGERSRTTSRHGSRRRSFNPRPPLPGSEAEFDRAHAPIGDVSTHAPRCRGAKPAPIPWRSRCCQFQPTPPVAGERSDITWDNALEWAGFNPRPPLPGSEAGRRGSRRTDQDVSTHAPRCRGAKHGDLLRKVLAIWFQPTPPVAGERSHPGKGFGAVSRSFNPRPPLPGSEAANRRRYRRRGPSFNPRPPLPGSEAWPCQMLRRRRCRFNPRPPLPGSEACGHAVANLGVEDVSTHAPRCRGAKPRFTGLGSNVAQVSTHAPRCRGAKPEPGVGKVAVSRVSTHAPRCRGAKPARSSNAVKTPMFQPTPPVAGERSVKDCGYDVWFAHVSTHAPRCRGAKPQ